MIWKIRRFFLGDRRQTDRVVLEAKIALQRLEQALSSLVDEQRRNTDEQ